MVIYFHDIMKISVSHLQEKIGIVHVENMLRCSQMTNVWELYDQVILTETTCVVCGKKYDSRLSPDGRSVANIQMELHIERYHGGELTR